MIPLASVRAALPGLAFAVALAIGTRLAWQATDEMLSPTLLAIAAGVVWRNAFGIGAWAERGVDFAAHALLRIGIALIGLRLTLLVLADVSLVAIPIVLSAVAVAVATALLLGRALGVGTTMRRLLAAGTAICGCTAIIAAAPLLRAQKAEVGIAMSCVVLFGSIAMLGYPWIAAALFDGELRAAGLFFGASIHDTAQVIGAALIHAEQQQAPEVVAIAGLTKFLRTLGLLLLVPLAAWLAAREQLPAAGASGLGRKAVPAFVIAFLALVLARTAGDAFTAGDAGLLAQWRSLLDLAQQASEWLLLVAMAAIGLGLGFAQIRDAGWRPVALAFAAALLTGATALAWCRVLA